MGPSGLAWIAKKVASGAAPVWEPPLEAGTSFCLLFDTVYSPKSGPYIFNSDVDEQGGILYNENHETQEHKAGRGGLLPPPRPYAGDAASHTAGYYCAQTPL